MSKDKTTSGPDGFGEFSAAQSGNSSSSKPKAGEDDGTLSLDALMTAQQFVGAATIVSQKEFVNKLNSIYRRFRVTDASSKEAVEAALVVYFAVHGTSPETTWSTYKHPIIASGVEVPPNDIVEIIGYDSLKRFMGRYSGSAVKLYQHSSAFKQAMRERAARAGLSDENGYLAIDYVGKDGKLDMASMTLRGAVKTNLVGRRNLNRAETRVRDSRGRAEAMDSAATVANAMGSVDPFQ